MPSPETTVETKKTRRPENDVTSRDLLIHLARLEARLARIEAHRQNADRELSTDWDDRAIEREDDEVVEALLPHTRREILSIRRALARIAEGDEITCEGCGDHIAPRRLALVPDTRFCAACMS